MIGKTTDLISERDLIAKPFFIWVGSLGIALIVFYMHEDTGVFDDLEFFIFISSALVGVIAFISTMIRTFKEKSIFYLVAVAMTVISTFYLLAYV